MTVAEIITQLQAMPQDTICLSFEDSIGDWVSIVAVVLLQSDNHSVVQFETHYDQ